MLAGVAAGTAAHLRQDPLIVRIAFAVLATAGIGIVAYMLLWLTMPVADTADGETAETGAGRRAAGTPAVDHRRPRHRRRRPARPGSQWFSGGVVLPLALVAGGLRHLAAAGHRPHPRRPRCPVGAGRRRGPRGRWRRAAGDDRPARRGAQRLRRHRGDPDRRRPRDAAHCGSCSTLGEERTRASGRRSGPPSPRTYDSVLQTLALIQRHADEPQAVGRLARSQERELRAWLYDPAVVREGGTWAGLVAGMVAEVESDHELVVDPVVVGDAPVDDALAALGAATREALVNAAKYSGATAADLYTEVTPERVSVFVRDRGAGFDPASVPPDRRGLRDSVTGRLSRLGGTARRPLGAGGGHRGGAVTAHGARHDARGCSSSTTTRWSAPACGPSSGTTSRWSARPPTSRAPSRASGRPSRTSSCSTCTCPAAVARCWRRCARSCPTCGGCAVGLRRGRGRHRRHPGRRAGLRHQDHLRARTCSPRCRVADGDVVFSPRLAGFVLDAFSAAGPASPEPAEEATDPGLDLLSAREREVVQLLARGYTYREIGSRLFISVKTVESHASNVLRKLQLSNRNELTRWAALDRLLQRRSAEVALRDDAVHADGPVDDLRHLEVGRGGQVGVGRGQSMRPDRSAGSPGR